MFLLYLKYKQVINNNNEKINEQNSNVSIL